MCECSVCYDVCRPVYVRCGHDMCVTCHSMWFAEHVTCPLCRDDITHPPSLPVVNKTRVVPRAPGFTPRRLLWT